MGLLCGNIYRIADLYDDENGDSLKVFVDKNGFIIDKNEMIFIKEILENCLQNITEKEILEINKKTYNDLSKYRNSILKEVELKESKKDIKKFEKQIEFLIESAIDEDWQIVRIIKKRLVEMYEKD